MRRMAMAAGSNVIKLGAPCRIALWQFGGLGDMLLATPVIRALQQAWPEADIHIWCSHPQFAEFLLRFPNVKHVHAFPVYDFDTRTLLHADARSRLRGILEAMRADVPDMLVNLHVPALLDWWAVEWWLVRQLDTNLSLGFDPRFIKYKSVFRFSLNVMARDNTHYTSLYRQLVEKAGVTVDENTLFPLEGVDKTKAELLLIRHKVGLGQRFICLHVGGRRLKVEGKMWSIENFSELARRLIDVGLIPVLIGVQSEQGMGEELCAIAPDCINLIACTNIAEMGALIALADGFVGHDSGPFHIAVAVNTPALAICGRPDAEPEYLKYDKRDVAVLIADSPQAILVDDVFIQVMALLNE